MKKAKSDLTKFSLRLLDKSYNVTKGAVKPNVHNSPLHELLKFMVAFRLMKDGHSIVTEAIFAGGRGRADIFVLDTMQVFEILVSETPEQFKNKLEKYPPEVDVIPIFAKDEIKDLPQSLRNAIGTPV